MEEIIQLKEQYYVLATSSLADQRTRVLKHGENFAVFDVYGNIQPVGHGTQGFYLGATRFLSLFELRVAGDRPLLLSSTVKRDNTLLTVDLMNRGEEQKENSGLLPGTLHIFRSKFLWNSKCYEEIKVSNFSGQPVSFDLSLSFRADFADIFEIRGSRREKKGIFLAPSLTSDSVRLLYEGLDKIRRYTQLDFQPSPNMVNESEAVFKLELVAGGRVSLFVTVSSAIEEANSDLQSQQYFPYATALNEAENAMRESKTRDCDLQSSNPQFNDWINRSQSDLHMMITETKEGPYPYAGVPLFNTVFGRDGLITALQTLWFNPEIARGVLNYLASTQSTEVNADQDAEPGKILHEVRVGEMVNLGEVPFRRYYGSADATPLFLLLAGEYFETTGDLSFVKSIWNSILAALEWIDRYGDADGDGFVEYFRKSPTGLFNQGWKDSHDSIFHADGSTAEGPIALCEVQAYVYSAKMKVAVVAREMGDEVLAEKLESEADLLREKFEAAFWDDSLGTYCLALDGKKNRCQVKSSNAGHALFGTIASPERARQLSETLFHRSMFSGWGIRTLSTEATRYNPMSYHNGSIWPHDNSLISEGLSYYGKKELTLRLLSGMFDASLFADERRLPELFCGIEKRPGEGPTLYPVACSPQAWASASIFLLLKASLGLSVFGAKGKVLFERPVLPPFLNSLVIRRLRCGPARLDLVIERSEHDVSVNIIRREGDVSVVVTK